ncbi:MAG: sugar transferase [Pseudomonadota bacterium]
MGRALISRSQFVALVLLPPILLILGMLYIVVVLSQGRPFLYTSERMRDAETAFRLYKIRTMTPAEGAQEMALGGHQQSRVTAIGKVLRRTRLDELPQIFNILKGDIGFIGPRPPLRRHVKAKRAQYQLVLRTMRPGITGLSTVLVHRREERLLAKCMSEAETEAVYLDHCLPLKLRIDLLYASRRGFALDILILWRTALRLMKWQPACGEITAPQKVNIAYKDGPSEKQLERDVALPLAA